MGAPQTNIILYDDTFAIGLQFAGGWLSKGDQKHHF